MITNKDYPTKIIQTGIIGHKKNCHLETQKTYLELTSNESFVRKRRNYQNSRYIF